MTRKHTGAVVLLGILLTVTLAAGNLVVAAHMTVLDPGFTTDTLEEEDGYAVLAETFEEQMAGQAPASDSGGDSGSLASLISMEETIEAAVDEEYMKSQAEPNIARVYAYLHGSTDTLNLSVDPGPISENIEAATAAQVANSSTAELMGAVGGGTFGDLPIEAETVEMLDEGPDAYEQAQADVRETVYQEVLASAVDQAMADSTNDELLALVVEDYDPAAHTEAEKEQMVEDRTDEIRSAVATEVERDRGEELQTRTDQVLEERATAASSESVSSGQPGIDEPATELRDVTITALTTDMSHETYQDQSTTAKENLGDGVGSVVAEEFLSGVGGQIDLNQEMGIPEEGALEQQRQIVGWLDRLAIVLPIVAILLLGGVFYLSRSVGRTAGTLGWSAAIAGLPAFLIATVLLSDPATLLDMQGGENPMTSILLGFIERTVDHLKTQSLALGLVGVGLVAIALAMRAGLHDRIRPGREPTTAGESGETESDSDPLADRADGQTESTDSGDPQQDER